MTPRYLFALSLFAGCGNSGGFPDAPPIDSPATAKFSVTWSVIDENSQPLPCSRIAAQNMTVLAHNKAFVGGETQIFTCDTGSGTSQDVFAGIFDLNFELSSASFGVLATAAQQTNVDIPAGSTTPLAPLVFQVEALGNLQLKLNAGGAGNCAGGAAIDTFAISVTRNSDGACVPVTFAVSAGSSGGTAGTYATSCSAPADYSGGCILSDQTLSATGVASDAYTVHIKGKKTGDCYINNDFLQVPPLSKTLTRTLNLAPTGAGC